MLIKAEVVLNYYDGPIEFVGKYIEPGMQFARSCFGFWVYEEESNIGDRLFSVWAVDSQGFEMEKIASIREEEIDWSEIEF